VREVVHHLDPAGLATDWKRRPTPWNLASGSTIAAGSMPAAAQAAIAASAFSTLWRPGTGSVKRRPDVENGCRPAPAPGPRRAPRDPRRSRSAARPREGRQVRALADHHASRVRAAKVANIAATSDSLW
jgi:hypothetical protein